mmetsp:Transcript_22167/g.36727  ORF Transcript_22167/g.36727 Transcript_22167/m.36727 type:complete len:123 (+) Transcript_22167:679-1047(+)
MIVQARKLGTRCLMRHLRSWKSAANIFLMHMRMNLLEGAEDGAQACWMDILNDHLTNELKYTTWKRYAVGNPLNVRKGLCDKLKIQIRPHVITLSSWETIVFVCRLMQPRWLQKLSDESADR